MNGIISATQRQTLLTTLQQQLTEQVEHLVEHLDLEMDAGSLETVVQTWSQEIGRRTLQTLVPTMAPRYAPPTVTCACGERGQYQRQRMAQVLTSLGRVRYQRAYYVCPTCHQGWCPLDTHLGWCAGSVSQTLQGQVALLAAQLPFAQVADLLQRLCGLTLSPTTCQVIAEQVGHWMHDHASDGTSDFLGDRVYVSMDGTMTHDRDEGWKEIRVGSVYTTTSHGADVRAEQHSYVVDRTSVESLADRLWQEFRRRGGRQAHQVVVIGDGALWIWHQAQMMWPTAVQIVDWYHACSHLQTAATALAERRLDAAAWLATQKAALWEGRIQEVLTAFHAIAWMSPLLADQETYFVRNQSRMHYARYRAQGLQIGSGSIESACKRVIGMRCKQAGMRWSQAGVTAIAALRAIYLSQRFDACFAACPPPTRSRRAA